MAYLTTLMEANRLDRLIVAIDALDELPDPPAKTPSITDFLPPAAELPRGCTIVLTGRPALRPRAASDLDRVRTASGVESFTTIPLDPAAPANRDLLRAYLLRKEHLPAGLSTPEQADAVIERAGGVFLYAFHLSRALRSGAYADIAALPDGDRFYADYLGRLRETAGDRLFEEVYLPALILLSAAFAPVTLGQLVRWGIPKDRLPFALIDLHDFLRVHRVRGWHDSLAPEGPEPERRYEIAHDAFLRFVRSDPTLSALLRDAHAKIGAAARPKDGWPSISPFEDEEIYNLIHVLPHLRESGRTDLLRAVTADESYAETCWAIGNLAQDSARFHIAEKLHDRSEKVYRELVDSGRVELANDLAGALMNRGNALSNLGRLAEAVTAYDEAVAILRRLVDSGRGELANDLAGALMNRGNALSDLGKLAEAVTAYDEAVAILRRLVDSGRVELANDLAKALMNRGVSLRNLGKLAEAVTAYDEAVAILRRLVDSGRVELANDLAKALMNRGVSLRNLGKLAEAVTAYDEAVAILRRLVDSGRVELANDLAMALFNKAWLLKKQEDWPAALECYDEAIGLREGCVEAGMVHLLGKLLQTIRYRMMTLLDLGRWDEAAEDVVRLLDHARPALEAEEMPQPILKEIGAMVGRLRNLPEEAWIRVESGLGDWAEIVRQWVKGTGEDED